VELARVIAADAGIELLSGGGFHGYSPQQVKHFASSLARAPGKSKEQFRLPVGEHGTCQSEEARS
jgi:hypothetical protein